MLNNKRIANIDTNVLSNSNTSIPTSQLIKKQLHENYISNCQYYWDITKYITNSEIPTEINISELYCTIKFNDSIEYHDLLLNSYITENYRNTELISSELEDYTNIESKELKNVCSIYIHDDYPYNTLFIPPNIYFNINNHQYKYTPQILIYDYFYNISYIKAPTIKVFTNTKIGHQSIKDDFILDNAAVIKCLDETTIYENIPTDTMNKLKIIPNTQYIHSSNTDLVPISNISDLDINNTTYQNPIIIKTNSKPANLLVYVKKGSIIINLSTSTSTEYQIDSLYHDKIPSSISDSDYSQLSIFHNALILPPNTELRLNYGSIIYPYSEFDEEFEVLYNNQQFSLKNIELHGISRNPESIEDKHLDGIYAIGGVVAYNRRNQENKIFLPKGTILSPGSLIILSTTYQYNQELDINSILPLGTYTTLITNYYNTQNLNIYLILKTTELLNDLYLPCINTDNIWKAHYSYPTFVANTSSKLLAGSEFYDITSYFNLNNSNSAVLSNSYRISLSNSINSIINYKDYSFIVKNTEFETINSNVYGYANHITISGGEIQTGNYTTITTFGNIEIQKYKSALHNNLIINMASNLQIKTPILRNFTLIIHCSQNTIANISDSGKIIENISPELDSSNQYVIKYIPATTIYDSIYSNCIISLSLGNIYLIELVPTVLNISNEYYDDVEYVKLTKNIIISDSYKIDSPTDTIYTKYNTLLKSGTKIAKNSIVNNIKYTSDYIIPIQNTPIEIPSKPSPGSILRKGSFITAGSILEGEKLLTDLSLPSDVLIHSNSELELSDDTISQYINIDSQIAPNSIFKNKSLLNGMPITNDIIVSGFLIVSEDSELAVGSIISAGSFITFEDKLQYLNRNDLIINSNSSILKLYNNSIIDKGSKITISSIINNKEVEYILSENKNITSESSLTENSIISTGSVLNVGSVLNGNYIRGDDIKLSMNTDIKSFTRILPTSIILSGAKIAKNSIINGEEILGEFEVLNLNNDYICDGNNTYIGSYLLNNTLIKSGSKLIIGSNYSLSLSSNPNPNTIITITEGDRKTVLEAEQTFNYSFPLKEHDIIYSGSKIAAGSTINNELISNIETQIAGNLGITISDVGVNILPSSILKSGSKIIIGSIINGYEYVNTDKTAIPILEDITISESNSLKYSILNSNDKLLLGSKIYCGSIINDVGYSNFNPEFNHNYENNSPDNNKYILTKILKNSILTNGNIINGQTEEGIVVDVLDSSAERHENILINNKYTKIAKNSRIIGGSIINNIEYKIDYDLIPVENLDFIISDSQNSEYIDRVVAVNSTVAAGSIISGINVNKTEYTNSNISNNDIQATYNVLTNLSGFKNKFTNVSHIVYYSGNGMYKRAILMKEFIFNQTINFTNGEIYYSPNSTYYAWSDVPQTGTITIWQNTIHSGTIMKPGSTVHYEVIEEILNLDLNSITISSNYGEFTSLDELELTCELNDNIVIENGINANLPFYAAPGSKIQNTDITELTFYQAGIYLYQNDIISSGSKLFSGFLNLESTNKLTIDYDTFSAYQWDGFRISTMTLKPGSKIRLLKEYIINNTIEGTTQIALFSRLTRILNDDLIINPNTETRFTKNINDVLCTGYKILDEDITILNNKYTNLSIDSTIIKGSIIKEYSAYCLLNNDILISNESSLKAKTWLSKNSEIKLLTGTPFITINSDIEITSETKILSGSTLTLNSNYYEKYKTLTEDLTNLKSITCISDSIIKENSILIKLINSIKTYNEDITITSNTIIKENSMLPYGSKIKAGSQINNKLIYGERKILDKNVIISKGEYLIKSGSILLNKSNLNESITIDYDLSNKYLIKSGSTILKDSIINNYKYSEDTIIENDMIGNVDGIYIKSGSTILKDSIINNYKYSKDTIIENDINGNSDIYIVSGSIIAENSILGDTIINETRQIEYNYSNSCLLNSNSILYPNSKIMRNSIINNEVINTIYIDDDILINNSSSLEIGSIILNGSLIKKGSIINNKLYTIDEELTDNLRILNSNSDLKQGTIILSGSIITTNSIINNIRYNETVTLQNNIKIENYAEILDGSTLITGSKIVDSNGNFMIVGSINDEGHFDDNHGYTTCKMKTKIYSNEKDPPGRPIDFIQILVDENLDYKYTYLTIDNLVVADVCDILSNSTNQSQLTNLTEYVLTKQIEPIYIKNKVNKNEVVILNQGSIINGNYEQIELNIIKVFNNEEEEPYGNNINEITIESEYFYSSCFNLKNKNNLSHVILKGQKIIDSSNIIVNYGSNIIFDSVNVEKLYIIPTEFTHIDLPKNNGWYKNCITKCLVYNNKLIYGIDEDKILATGRKGRSVMTDITPIDYIFNLFNIDSTIYISVESEFSQNLIKLCLGNRKLIGNLITKVNNQHLNLYIQNEKYSKIINNINKYSYINLISEGYHNVLSEFELIKNTNILYIDKNCYYDSTFGIEIIKPKSENEIYYYSKGCLNNVKTSKIIFTSNVIDNSEKSNNYHIINFENNSFTINENDIPDEIIIMPGTNIKTLYINKNNIVLHLKDYVKILVISDNLLDANAMTIHLNENCQLDSIIIDEPTQLKRSNTTAMYINAKNFVFESTFDVGSMDNYTGINRNVYINYKLLDLTYELHNDITNGYLTVVESSDYEITGVSHVLKYDNPYDRDISKYEGSVREDGVILNINKFEEIRGYKTKMIFNGLVSMKQYFSNQNLVLLLLVREILKVPGIAIVNEYCNIYVYYDLNSWRTANFKAHSYTKVGDL